MSSRIAQPLGQVMESWRLFREKSGNRPAQRNVAFHKEGHRLVIYEYGPKLCGTLAFEKRAKGNPQLLSFKEWHQPLTVAASKLLAAGWEFEHSAQAGGSYAH